MIDIKAKIDEAVKSKKSGIMQYPDELLPFMEFMRDNNVKSYLEIGVKRGFLPIFMKKVLKLDLVYACDIKQPSEFENPEVDIELFLGDSHSKKYRIWREAIKNIDMVLIDASHKYKDAKADYKRELSFPHKFLALHDIHNSGYPELQEFWEKEVKRSKIEFVNKDPNANLICIENRTEEYIKNHKKKYGTSCGIGVCWD
tara:strand:+ start:1168 stop:1767 length:600 start_codon:yes stop_codon:yes gene_type:complete